MRKLVATSDCQMNKFGPLEEAINGLYDLALSLRVLGTLK
jgi:hypothetical protein